MAAPSAVPISFNATASSYIAHVRLPQSLMQKLEADQLESFFCVVCKPDQAALEHKRPLEDAGGGDADESDAVCGEACNSDAFKGGAVDGDASVAT